MTKITIHGQKMQYHKKVAISVTLIPGEGGTATFTPATGTSYTLSSLPIGTRIVKSTDTLYPLSDANGNSVGTITLVASSGYNVDEVSITRGGVKTTIGIVPIVLQEGDSIAADFEASTIGITFYNDKTGQWYSDELGKNMMDYEVLSQGYYIINGMYQDTGYWYLNITNTSEEEHFDWYFIPESGYSYTGLEINGKTPTFPYTFGTDDLTIVASTEQADVLIIDTDGKNGRWVDSSGTYIASAVTIPYANININFEGKQQSPNSITSLRFSIRGDKDNEMFNYTYYYEYTDGYNIYLELDGTSITTSATWGKSFSSGQHTLDARATEPVWKYYGLTSSEKTAIQNFISSSDNCLGQRASSVNSYAYCFIRNSGLLLCIDKYGSNFMGFTIAKATAILNKYACGTDSKLSNMDFGAITNFERAGDTNNLEHALTNGGFSSIDDFCEYVMTTFNLS